jgi:hypothetical protein
MEAGCFYKWKINPDQCSPPNIDKWQWKWGAPAPFWKKSDASTMQLEIFKLQPLCNWQARTWLSSQVIPIQIKIRAGQLHVHRVWPTDETALSKGDDWQQHAVPLAFCSLDIRSFFILFFLLCDMLLFFVLSIRLRSSELMFCSTMLIKYTIVFRAAAFYCVHFTCSMKCVGTDDFLSVCAMYMTQVKN